MDKCLKIWEKCEKFIKMNEFKKIKDDEILILMDYFNEKNKLTLLKIFTNDEYEYFIKESNKLFIKSKEDNELEEIYEEIENRTGGMENSILYESEKKDENENKDSLKKNDSIIIKAIESDDNNSENDDEEKNNSNSMSQSIINISQNSKISKNNDNLNSEKSNKLNYSNLRGENKDDKNLIKNDNIENINNNQKNEGEEYNIKNNESNSNKSNNFNNILENEIIISEKLSESINQNYSSKSPNNSIKTESNVFKMISSSNNEIIKIEDKNEEEDKKKQNVKLKEYPSSILKYVENDISLKSPSLKVKVEKYEILQFCKIIGIHRKNCEFIKELSNGYFISGGKDNKLILYNCYFSNILEIKEFSDWSYNIYEPQNIMAKIDEEIHLITFFNDKPVLVVINTKKKEYKKILEYKDLKYISNCLKMNSKDYIFCSKYGSFSIFDAFQLNIEENNKKNYLNTNSYKGAIKINENIAVITSNRVIAGGEDKLLFYNSNSKKFFNKIEGYSFIESLNGLAIMPREEIETKNKIILCACKKYFSNQKNGILLININIEDEENKLVQFYDTENYEVYCFCPILNLDNKDNKDFNPSKKHKIKISDTNFFLVGGFDKDKNQGIIKLYKIIFSEDLSKPKIEFIQDIIIKKNKNFKGFKRPISCMIQSRLTGNILISCLDGIIFLFTAPNIEMFLLDDKKKVYI